MGITEVAAHAGVSPATVSNVLNRPERVAPVTRTRVETAVVELDYVRNSSGSNLRSGRNDSVGLVVLDVTNPFFTEVARGVEDEAAEEKRTVLLFDSAEDTERQWRSLRMLAEHRAAGAVVMPTDGDLTDLLWLRDRGVSWVVLDRGDVGDQIGCSVSVDNRAGGEAAGRHLIALGHEYVTLVCGPLGLDQVRRRVDGVRAAYAANGVDPDTVIRVVEMPQLNPANGEEAAEAVLAGGPKRRPGAVFCANDQLALGLLKALNDRGLSIPRDLSLVGYDDISVASLVHPGLTTVAQPKYELGRAAMRLLHSELGDSGHVHQSLVFGPELVVRGSTAANRA